MKKLVGKVMRNLGYTISKFRDPYQEMLEFVDASSDMHIIDGGAYIGGITQCFADKFPNAHIHAFEPQLRFYQNLKETYNNLSRVHIYDYALSDFQGETVFYINEEAYTSSLSRPTVSYMHQKKEVTVKVTTLDGWAKKEGVQPKIIKLDLQGFELAALRGGSGVLAETDLVLCEINFVPRYQEMSTFDEVVAYLSDHGFALFRFYDIRNNNKGHLEMGDALFVKKDLYFQKS